MSKINTSILLPPTRRFTVRQLALAAAKQAGFCLACGKRSAENTCEPDAERYECQSCGQRAVYGAEQIASLGFIK